MQRNGFARVAVRRTAAVVAVPLAVTLALSACAGGTAPAPTPVHSTDLTSADGGFDAHAVIGVVLAPPGHVGNGGTGSGAGGAPVTPGATESSNATLAARFQSALTDAGYQAAVRVATAADAVGSEQDAIRDLVRSGAKVVLIQPPDGRASALANEVQYAHDAGALVVAVDAAIPGTGGSGTAADYRVRASSDAALVDRAVRVVGALQRGKKPASS